MDVKKVMVTPLVGIELDGATIALSATREDVEGALGKGEASQADPQRLYYFESELRFDFDGDDRVEFIEFLGGVYGRIQPIVYGVAAFQRDADFVYDLLRKENHGPIDDDGGYSYAFMGISVGLYRSFLPTDDDRAMAAAVEEGKKGSENWSEEEWEDFLYEEWQRAIHWETIGIGVKDYYRDE